MPKLVTHPLAAAETTTLMVDHIGVVVHDLAAEVMAWRNLGFAVSDPVALMAVDAAGRSAPLGQASAHVVFENCYVELSSPDPGSGNHLESYLAHGEGVRILVLATGNAVSARDALRRSFADMPEARLATRDVVIDGIAQTARFLWFPLPVDIVPITLSAVVQHLTPDLVFHPSLIAHPNGARRISGVRATGRISDLHSFDLPPPQSAAARHPPSLDLSCGPGTLRIDGLGVADCAGAARHVAL